NSIAPPWDEGGSPSRVRGGPAGVRGELRRDFRRTGAAVSGRGGPGNRGHQGRAEWGGRFLSTGSIIVPEFRRRNLRSFPFFVLYGWTGELLVFGSLIPTRSDPLQWLKRFGEAS